VLYPIHAEIRSFSSVAKILNNLAYRTFSNSNRLELKTALIFNMTNEQLNYTSLTSVSSCLNFQENLNNSNISANFSHFLFTSFLNDFFLTDSVTRSSQFLSLASKNYIEVTSNFLPY
jgi:hypothetical protein